VNFQAASVRRCIGQKRAVERYAFALHPVFDLIIRILIAAKSIQFGEFFRTVLHVMLAEMA
jgi:hypothetical protein